MELQIIHVVLGKANPDRMNGVNKVVNSLAIHQCELGYDVSVWGLTKNLSHNYPERNYKTKLFSDLSKFRLDPRMGAELEKLDTKTTVFHLHGGFIPQFHAVARLLRNYGFRYVLTPHGAYNIAAMQRSWLKKRIYIKAFEAYLVSNAHAVHLIGESEIHGTTAVFGKVPYAVIPNGQEKRERAFDSEIRKSDPVFGFVGRLDTRTKGLDILFQAFANFLAAAEGSGQLWLIGDGPDADDLRALAQKLDISSNVKFLGAKYGVEKEKLMQSMDFLCLNSRNEGLPGVVLEAAALGVPVIVSRETNMAPYVKQSKAGFFTEENNPTNLSSKLAKAAQSIADGSVAQLADGARKMVADHFDWNHISQQHVATYVR